MLTLRFFSLNVENPDLTCETRDMGTYPYIQVTYEFVRVGPGGDHIARFTEDGYWLLYDSGLHYSDFEICPE